jgi:hypothetical protein
MKIMKYIGLLFLIVLVQCSSVFSQARRASQYLDLVPLPPVSIAEAQSRLSSQGEDVKAAALLREIELNSDTTQPLTTDDANANKDGHPLSAKPAIDYGPLKKSIESTWARLEDSIIILIQNPRLTLQNTIAAIGEKRVKALEKCKHAKYKKRVSKQKQDSLCIANAEAGAVQKRDKAANDYLGIMQQNWGQYKSMLKSYLEQHEQKLDSIRAASVEASMDQQAKKIEVSLLSVVRHALQTVSEITKTVVEAGAR